MNCKWYYLLLTVDWKCYGMRQQLGCGFNYYTSVITRSNTRWLIYSFENQDFLVITVYISVIFPILVYTRTTWPNNSIPSDNRDSVDRDEPWYPLLGSIFTPLGWRCCHCLMLLVYSHYCWLLCQSILLNIYFN